LGTLVHLATGLGSWLQFVAFTVFPVAFGELVHWLHDWQVLASAIILLVAAHIWGSAILKAARLNVFPQNGVGRLQRPLVEAAEASRPAAPVEVEQGGPAAGGQPRLERLNTLRREIRVMLGTLPCTDDPLSVQNWTLCGRIAQLGHGEPGQLAQEGLADLKPSLDALASLDTRATNRAAWAALVRLNDAARNAIEAAEQPEAGGATVDWDSLEALRRRRRDG